jgi:hypothetical protein
MRQTLSDREGLEHQLIIARWQLFIISKLNITRFTLCLIIGIFLITQLKTPNDNLNSNMLRSKHTGY